MTSTHEGAVDLRATASTTADPQLQTRITTIGLAAAMHERTSDARARLIAHLADPMATDSRASYTAWLRRQANAWARLNLPAVPVASLDWPLSSVRPQCLDVVGLLIADLRELDPGRRSLPLPRTAASGDPSASLCVAAAMVCVSVAELSAGLLATAAALTSGRTATGSATRYLHRCADLAGRGAGLDRELDSWGCGAGSASQVEAVTAAEAFSSRLADAFDAGTRTGW